MLPRWCNDGTHRLHPGRAAFVLLILVAPCRPVPAADTLDGAVSSGEFHARFRYRFEHVDDDLAAQDADASTLRSVIGYRTGEFSGFSFALEGEQISRLSGHYREYPGQPGNTRALVADPDATELNQGYLQYESADGARVRAGRQIITYRDDPFHRFIGSILWRQNWQTFDAVAVESRHFPDTTLNYAWIDNVNRIFGDNSPPALSDLDSNTHLFNIQNDHYDAARLEAYAYLLDFNDVPLLSSRTFGGRLSGEHPLSPSVTALYALEYAFQADHGDHPGDFEVSYQLIEAGLRYAPVAVIDELQVKAGYERLGGNGRFAFQTPLGTNHAFQGTADRFLTTPADGIRDYQFVLQVRIHGFKLTAGYHVLDSDEAGYCYGNELDLELGRKLGKRFTIGAKYADYDADGNATSRLRNGTSTVTTDARKFWLFITAGF